MVWLVVPVILHDEFLLFLDDVEPTSCTPLPADGAVTLPYQIIILEGIGHAHLQCGTPVVTAAFER